MLQIGAASLLEIRASVVSNWGSYYKSGEPLLQNRASFKNWVKIYYKLWQVLEIRAIITNWGITSFVEYSMIWMMFMKMLINAVQKTPPNIDCIKL